MSSGRLRFGRRLSAGSRRNLLTAACLPGVLGFGIRLGGQPAARTQTADAIRGAFWTRRGLRTAARPDKPPAAPPSVSNPHSARKPPVWLATAPAAALAFCTAHYQGSPRSASCGAATPWPSVSRSRHEAHAAPAAHASDLPSPRRHALGHDAALTKKSLQGSQARYVCHAKELGPFVASFLLLPTPVR